mgnify:CR=1 FL=1
MVNNFRIYKNFNLSKKDKEAIILIGNFDGLHRGHQKLFNKAKSFKKKFKLRIGVITFDPIPKMFFKKLHNYRLSNFDQKIQLFKKNYVDFIVNQKFDIKFSKISCFDFIKKILFNKIKPKYIFVSDNFRFGYKRAGDIKLLKSLGKDYDYKIINPSPLKSKKFVISSTLIRKKISLGKNCLLGANSGLGIPLGDRCTVEAGLYLTAASKVEIVNDQGEITTILKASELSSKSDLLFIRNSLTGSIQCRPNKNVTKLNEELHSNE